MKMKPRKMLYFVRNRLQINHESSAHPLRHRTVVVRNNTMGTMNFRNRTLFHGDNLEFLRGMNSETVDLIATDPPFDKNQDFWLGSASKNNCYYTRL